MKLETVNAFVQATGEVLSVELGTSVTRGEVVIQRGAGALSEVTTILSVTGDLNGMVAYAMSRQTALRIVSQMMGEPFEQLDELGRSGVAELGNMITGNAVTLLTREGYSCDIAPPMVAVAEGSVNLSLLDLPRLVIPLQTGLGPIDLQVALRERAA